MTLATQCPHCKTTFRVAQDQLKLRAGLVRCGACREIFNGIEHLLPADTQHEQAPAPATPVAEPPLRAPSTASALLDFAYPEFDLPQSDPFEAIRSAKSARSDDAADILNTPTPQPDVGAAAILPAHIETVAPQPASAYELDWEIPTESLPVETAPVEPISAEFSPAEPSLAEPLPAAPIADEADPVRIGPEPPEHAPAEPFSGEPFITSSPAEIEQSGTDAVAEPALAAPSIIEAAQRKSARKKRNPYAPREDMESSAEPDSAETEEPDFVKQGRRKQRLGRSMRITMLSASAVLLLAALGQGIYAFRDQIAARLPEARPALLAGCGLLRCEIALPMQIESISIESDQLETLSANKDDSELTMLLRNSSSTTQAWPHIELTLNDASGSLLARRVFSPREYLTDTRIAAHGLPSNSEQTVKLDLAVVDAKPAGYRVGVFYP
jgi:predicted Zn finger-like uncharacterized protein